MRMSDVIIIINNALRFITVARQLIGSGPSASHIIQMLCPLMSAARGGRRAASGRAAGREAGSGAPRLTAALLEREEGEELHPHPEREEEFIFNLKLCEARVHVSTSNHWRARLG
ncbi:unnamed protein product [Pleuronectes platessa]|uniref:Uncharacterized protein n=1 Tax=Pleuronectes platessa TaxID=8262 RepID=A0A9N7V0T7_PLEPL|nr:unnamed protein product [Pleuronectes platessa]